METMEMKLPDDNTTPTESELRARGDLQKYFDLHSKQVSRKESSGMKHDDFQIGKEFQCGGKRWRCTDVGTRVIVAICLSEAETNLSGPPYMVEETVFDENDFAGCEEVAADERHPEEVHSQIVF